MEKNRVIAMSKATPLQSGMLFYSILNEESTNYREQISFYLHGKVNADVLQRAWQEIVNRHEVFRTDFRWKEAKNPVQIVLERKTADIYYRNISDLEAIEQQQLSAVVKADDLKIRFSFEEGKLNRLSILQLAIDEYFICWTFHHILLDGWSVQIVLHDFLQICSCLTQNRELPAKPARQFSEYVKWLDRQNRQQTGAYWQQYIGRYLEPTCLPPGTSVAQDQVIKCAETWNISIEENTLWEIEAFCRQEKITLNALIQAGWGLLLQKYNNTAQSCFGMTMSLRPAEIPGVESIVGLMINTLPVIVDTKAGETVGELLNRVNQDLVERAEYGAIALTDIMRMTRQGNAGLFNTMIAFENYPLSDMGQWSEEFQLTLDTVYELTNYDLTIAVLTGDRLTIKMIYNPELFSADAIQQIGESFVLIIRQVVSRPEATCPEVEVVNPADKEWLLRTLNQTVTVYPKEYTLSELFEEQVAKNPEKVAAVYAGEHITYQELNTRANQLARVLRARGVKQDTIVGIMVERSLEMLTGILAILKAGGAYLPLDPEFPQGRVSYMLEDCGVTLLLTHSQLRGQTEFAGEVIELAESSLYTGETANPGRVGEPDSLAYIIYTSGTTGKPKGIMTMHYNVTRVVKETNYIEITPEDRILQLSNYAFDGSVFDIFGALLNGATLVLVSKEHLLDMAALTRLIKAEEITLFFVTTALFNTIVDTNLECFQSVRRVLFGGERVSVPHVRKAFDFLGSGRIVHVYGPTESTVYATYYSIEAVSGEMKTIPIGKCLANTQIYIVGQDNTLMPTGVPGEICIAGDGLARGYLHRADLTDEKFVPNPFVPGTKMYRSGDLGRWLPDGSIEFVDRIDQQVKVRGFRIELGEIESQILCFAGVKEAVVVARVDRGENRYLCGYLVADGAISIPELKEFLRKDLPEYMIPAHFIVLDKLPVNSNGKVNKKELPEPDANLRSVEYAAPTNEFEERLVRIWTELLGIEQCGIDDNFFELGGHSLKATGLVAKINKEFNVELPLRTVFKLPTIRELANYIGKAAAAEYQSIPQLEEQEAYQVSSAQKRLLVLYELEPDSTGYNLPAVMLVEGEVDKTRLENVFRTLVRRHEALRTSFEMQNGIPVQIVHHDLDFTTRYSEELDLTPEMLVQRFIRPFDLSCAPLLRVELVKLAEKRHLFMLDMHHIIADGLSMQIILQEFVQLYQGESLAELKIQYKDFAAWQNGEFATEKYKQQEAFWLETFAGELPVLDLPTDFSRPAVLSFKGNRVHFTLDAALTTGLKRLAQETGSTFFMVLLAGYNVLLSKYTGQEDVIIGSPVAGRGHADLENIVGMFVNTLACRNYPQSQKTFIEFLAEVRENALRAFENQDYQFEMLIDRLGLERNLSRNPLFDTMFSLQNMSEQEIQLSGVKMLPYSFENPTAKFDLELIAAEAGPETAVTLEYSTELFRRATAEKMCQHFVQLLTEICEKKYVRLADLEMLTQKEKEYLIYGLNSLQAEFPRERSIYHLFEEHVSYAPGKVAIRTDTEALTYGELNARVNRLANHLRKCGICDDRLAGILMDRSVQMVESILAVWKACGGYIPVDPAYPVERIVGILQDSGAQLLISTAQYVTDELEAQCPTELLLLDRSAAKIAAECPENLNLTLNMQNLAYVIYTSGSTGKPKGAMVEHIGMMNHIQAKINDLQLTRECVVSQNASHCFDISVWQFFVALTVGGTTNIYSNGLTLQPEEFLGQVVRDGVTILEVVPSYLSVMLDSLEVRFQHFTRLRYLLVTGEAVKPRLIQRWFALYPGIKVVNAYGPTEASDDITHYIMESTPEGVSVPIGKPLHNFHIYVVTPEMKLCPVGVKGEICVSGVGVGRGYLNNAEKTAQAFMADPFVAETGRRLYKTGDIGRWLPDGNIEFFGRKDFQVKIRGFRIELGEIESKLVGYPAIKEAVVIDREDNAGNKYLCAYVVANAELDVAGVRKYLAQSLPDYMVPGHFVRLDAIPLNANGKVDRKALPVPDTTLQTGSTEFVAPSTAMEVTLAGVWAEVLGLGQVSIRDNFFTLGGDSIKAIQIAARLQKDQLKLEIKDLFQNPTIEGLAPFITQGKHSAEQGTITGEVLLTPVQQEFFEKIRTGRHHFNQAVVLDKADGFAVEKIQALMEKLVEHHDALRLTFAEADGQLRAFNRGLEEEIFTLEVFDYSGVSAHAGELQNEINRIHSGMNLEHGPLVKLGLFKTATGDRLLISIHHLVIDGVSWRILLEDFAAGYRMLEQGQELRFPEKTDSYQLWAEALQAYASSEELHNEWNYWSRLEMTEVAPLPLEHAASINTWGESKEYRFELSAGETEQLLAEANKAYNTEINDLLLTALGQSVKEWAKVERVLIALEGHGREEINAELNITRTVGWFTSIYPLLLDVQENELASLLKVTKERLRQVPDKGIGYGILRYLTPESLRESLQFRLNPEICFNYLGQLDDNLGGEMPFSVSTLATGEVIGRSVERKYLLDFNSFVSEGRLQMTITYNQKQYDEGTVAQLAERYRANLLELIAHCCQKEEVEFTPSDYGDYDLSFEELNKISQRVLQLKKK